MRHYKIAVNTPFNNSLLTYGSEETLQQGQLVGVPLGKRTEKGCVVEEESPKNLDLSKIKPVKEVLEDALHLRPDYFIFLKWVSSYYHYPLGQHIFDVLPKEMKRPRDIEFIRGEGHPLPYSYTAEQEEAIKRIDFANRGFKKFLLHGVTGSGKTTVYIDTIQKSLKENKSVLFLVPEINLTPQFLKNFKEHLEGKILTYHSSISNSEKYKVWKEVEGSNEPFVLIGVRSSIFLPFNKIGLIIVDEEHDTSFKQEDRCPYHARDVAIKLASMKNIPILLGSATPTVESIHSTIDTDSYVRMKNRPKELAMPEFKLIDSRSDKSKPFDEDLWPFTEESLSQIKERVNQNEQVLVFVNRLGFASYVQCRSCGHDFHCPNCSTNLKYFKRYNALCCQYCDFKLPYPDSCPECGNLKLLQKGFGTERLEEVLQKKLPESKIGRFDRDVIKNFKMLKETLNDFQDKKLDILVGTQMLSKGHNFHSVNLVVVLGVDSQLNFPDFRSNEKVFQILTQTGGRPGRSERQGLVLVETLSPENKIFEIIKNYDIDTFYKEELEIREALNFPPFSRLTAVYLSSRFQDKVASETQKAAKVLRDLIQLNFKNVELLGPRPALVEKRANKFTWTVLLRTRDVAQLHNLLNSFQSNFKGHHSLSVKIDVDPQTLL